MYFSPPKTLRDIIAILESKLKGMCQVEVRRNYVFADLIKEVRRKFFNPSRKLKTWFVGEPGKDTGGLTRELWRLFGKDLYQLCDGPPASKVPRHDASKLQVCIEE